MSKHNHVALANQKEVLDWSVKHGRRPTIRSKNKKEKELAIKLYYLMETTSNYIEFTTTYRAKFPPRNVCRINDQELFEKAQLYKTREDFKKDYLNYYVLAWKRGILSKVCKHMIRPNAKPIRCKETGQVFKGSRDAARQLKLSFGTVAMVARGDWPATKGYSFEYV